MSVCLANFQHDGIAYVKGQCSAMDLLLLAHPPGYFRGKRRNWVTFVESFTDLRSLLYQLGQQATMDYWSGVVWYAHTRTVMDWSHLYSSHMGVGVMNAQESMMLGRRFGLFLTPGESINNRFIQLAIKYAARRHC